MYKYLLFVEKYAYICSILNGSFKAQSFEAVEKSPCDDCQKQS